MPILNYSGGRGRGRGRHNNHNHSQSWAAKRKPNTKKWVRPKQESRATESSSSSQDVPSSGVVVDAAQPQASVSAVVPPPQNSNDDSSSSIIIRKRQGPKNKRMILHSQAHQATSKDDNDLVSPDQMTLKASAEQNMTHLGRNKLVKKKSTTSSKVVNAEDDDPSSSSSLADMKAKVWMNHHHRRKRSRPDSSLKSIVAENDEDEDSSTNKNAGGMKRIGRHKLVLPSSSSNIDIAQATTTTTYERNSDTHQTFRHNTKQHPTRRKAPHHKHPPPGGGKRIKISIPVVSTTTAQSGSHQDNDEEDSTSKARTTEKLTDHAYRHTSQVAVVHQPSSSLSTRRSKNKQWINNHLNPETSSSSTTNTPQPKPTLRGGPTHKAMGLVRVTAATTRNNNDTSTLAVCPTFLRGKPCEDPLCRRRHDVPKQAAMPVCHYFLHHHGQCTNRKCPFRHVKVNPNTLDCPTFLQWGYCKDDDCRMKHERSLVQHHEKKHKNKNKVWKGGKGGK